MKRSNVILTGTLAAVLGTIGLSQAGSWGHRWHGGGHEGGPRGGLRHLCSPERSERVEQMLEAISGFVNFSAEQQRAWDALSQTVQEVNTDFDARCQGLDEAPATAPERVALLETLLGDGLAAVQRLRPAFENFYATLTPEQQAILDRVSQRRGSWHPGAAQDAG